jgi:hypothetical protein
MIWKDTLGDDQVPFIGEVGGKGEMSGEDLKEVKLEFGRTEKTVV